MNPPKILITGGLGFIFSYVTEHFVRKGWEVVVIDNFSTGAHPEIIDGSFKHYNVHMADPEVVPLIIRENPDYLIHAAAITDVDYSVKEPYRTMVKNTLGMLHAFEAARQLPDLKKFMYVATDEVYGECDHEMKETENVLPRSPYSCSKAVGSLARVAYDNTYPTLKDKTVETRMCNIFGGRQDTRKIMPLIKKSLRDGHSIPLHGGGSGYREYLYVKNIPSVTELLLEKGTGVYNISLNEGLTVKELIEKAEAFTGKKVTTHEGNRPGMDMRYQVDASRVRELGWKPLYSFEEGFREYILEDDAVAQKKKKIVIGTNDLLLGGVQRLVIDQLRALDQSLFEVHLIVLMEFKDKETFADVIPEGVTVHNLRFSGFKDIRKWWKLIRLLRRLRPDIVKTATFFSNTVFLALRPVFGYSMIAAEHNTVTVKPLWQRLIDKILLPQAHTVIGDSNDVVAFVSEKEGVDPKHFTVLYNGVDTDAVEASEKTYAPLRTDIRAEYGIPKDAHVIFSAGRLAHQKNHHLMIESFAKFASRHKNAYLIIAGGGERLQSLKELASSLGVGDRVFLLGDQKNVHRLYAIADTFLLTSRHEGFCIAAMEGLAFGMPLISTRVAGVSEYLQEGVNGFFVEAEPEDIAKKLEKAASFSPEERSKFREAGKRTAAAYSVKRYRDAFTAIVHNALEERGSRL